MFLNKRLRKARPVLSANRFAISFGVLLSALVVQCHAAPLCQRFSFLAKVEITTPEFTLADLLATDECAYDPALELGRTKIGRSPKMGSLRVIEGREIRDLLSTLELHSGISGGMEADIPGRIEIRHGEKANFCQAVARAIAEPKNSSNLGQFLHWSRALNCVGAHANGETTSFVLLKTAFDAGLQRWEFILRCTPAATCAPFMVWSRSRFPVQVSPSPALQAETKIEVARSDPSVIRKGQSAMLVWESSGIRVVVPVTCLDEGKVGQLVRAQLKNANRTLRAKVIGPGSLRFDELGVD